MKTTLFLTAVMVLFTMVNGNSQVEVLANKVANTYMADVQLSSDNLIIVRVLNVDNQKVKVMVIDSNGEKIQSQSFTTDGILKVAYKIKSLPADDLTFKVMVNNQLVCQEKVVVLENGKVEIPVPVIIETESKNEINSNLITKKL